MALDPRRLRPSDVCKLLNSVPRFGTVLSERKLYHHRLQAGLRIGDDKHVDLFRYNAWLVYRRHIDRKTPEDVYERIKQRARARNIALSLAGRDIGELPAVVNSERKALAKNSLKNFCESYFPSTFYLPWSNDHLHVISRIEQAVLSGGLFAVAMPRGSGKTSLVEAAGLWALLFGHRNFVVIITATESHAEELLSALKVELETNDLLLADFPEVCYPIRCLDGIANRCAGQLYHGKRTYITWTSHEIVLPTIPGSPASGGVVKVAGITGRIRGMTFKRSDGKTIRPSLVILDDPQTDESARSPAQCAYRESIISGAILGLAGPGQKISAIMPCTVIYPGDLADRMLNRDLHPEWQGERYKTIYAFPANMHLWDEYAKIRAECLRAGKGIADATEFYRRHREEMDAGAVVAWPERHNYDELSGIQHAMNLKLQNERAFWSEYQNEPIVEVVVSDNELTIDRVLAKLNGLPRGMVPSDCNHITAFVDVQQRLLYYTVIAWCDNFTGYIIDYGTHPEQNQDYFLARDAKITLSDLLPNAGLEATIYAGLEAFANKILACDWLREDKVRLRIERCLIDANWGQSTNIVYEFCRQSPFSAALLPAHGRYVGAASIPFSQYRRRPGERIGLNWRISPRSGRRGIRYVIYDTNYWKSFICARFLVPLGEPGSLSLFGRNVNEHRLFVDHVTAEYCVRTEGRGRVVDEWKMRPDRTENHWFDCLVGSAVAASMQGVVLPGTGQEGTLDGRMQRKLTRKQRS